LEFVSLVFFHGIFTGKNLTYLLIKVKA